VVVARSLFSLSTAVASAHPAEAGPSKPVSGGAPRVLAAPRRWRSGGSAMRRCGEGGFARRSGSSSARGSSGLRRWALEALGSRPPPPAMTAGELWRRRAARRVQVQIRR
jgi:hypothetical protein